MKASGPARNRLSARAEAWVADRWTSITASVSAAAFAASGLVGDAWIMHLGSPGDLWHYFQWKWFFFSVGAVAFVAAIRSDTNLHKQLKDVQEQLKSAQLETESVQLESADLQRRLDNAYTAAWTITCRLVVAFFKTMRGNSEERVTVYYHTGRHFVRLVRWAPDPTLRNEGRVKVPDGQGVVWNAWKKGADNLFLGPDECQDLSSWRRAMEKKGQLPSDALGNISMQSVSFLVRRIEDTAAHRPCGVVVFESTRYVSELEASMHADCRDVLSMHADYCRDVAQHMDRIWQGPLGKALSQAVVIISEMSPVDPGLPKGEGF